MIPILFLGLFLGMMCVDSASTQELPHYLNRGGEEFLLSAGPGSSFYSPESYLILNSTPLSTPSVVSLGTLLAEGETYHGQRILVRGVITQPELHLDESELFIDFVFRLSDGEHSLIVFGQHDRTLGPPVIVTDRSVEVMGIFWKTRNLNSTPLSNIVEAITVSPYPPSIPDRT